VFSRDHVSSQAGRWLPRAAIGLVVSLSLALVGVIPAGAQSNRTWVSGVGNDFDACSVTAPCKTFAGAFGKTAAGGEIDVLTPGGFGNVTITHSITINSDNLQAGVVVSGGGAITINAGATDTVVLRGLDMEGLGTDPTAINVFKVGTLVIDNTTINNFTQYGISTLSNTSTASTEFHLTNLIVRNAGTAGVLLKQPSGQISAALDAVTLDHGGSGLQVMDNARATIRNSLVSNNTAAGLQAQAAVGTADLSVENTAVSANGTGIQAGGSTQASTVRISNVTVIDNTTGIGIGTAGSVLSFGNNSITGNGTNGAPSGTVPLQ
jgi:hypothetical protein